MTKQHNKLLLHACPRCYGDLFQDLEDEDFLACLQCGRRILESQLTQTETAPAKQLAPAA
jgi:predicted  nucleic acid-binding Zn-ribbon protein